MQISGQIRTTCPPAFLLKALRDPLAMIQLLPSGSKLEQSGENSYAFTMTKSVGPIRLTLPGTLTLTPTGEGHNQKLTIHAAHLIAGKVDLTLQIVLDQASAQTRIGYDGELEATGLSGRILKEHRARANEVVKAALTRFRLRAESEFAKTPAAV